MAQKGKAKLAKMKKSVAMNMPQHVFVPGHGFLPVGRLGEAMAKRIFAGEAFHAIGDGQTCIALFDDDGLVYGADLALEVFGKPSKNMPSYRAWAELRAQTASIEEQKVLIDGASL